MNTDFYLNRLEPVIGSTVTSLVRSGEDELGDEFFGLILTAPDGKQYSLWILRDDEGNGPGSFELEPMQ